jgi:hypothetical protein
MAMALALWRPRAFALMLAVAILALPIRSACSQDFMERSVKQGPQPEEKRPTVSDKDYKAALQKIPTPTEKYDPWGGARPADQTKTANKPAKKRTDGEP